MVLTAVITTIVILFSCSIGAIVGFGGGVIIKPVLDSMGFFTIDIVNFISSFAVLAMSISSIIRHIRQKTEFNKKLALLVSVGAVVGGVCGNRLFSLAVSQISNDIMKALQAIIIIIFVGFSLYFVNKQGVKTFKATSPVLMLLTGLLLGTLNSFLGIGGGPINIMALLLVFSLAVKQGAVYSISIVFFCQMSNMITLFISNQFKPYYDYFPYAICAVVAGILGGIIGSSLNKKLPDKTVRIIFSLVMLMVFGINAYNAVSGIFF